MDRINMPSADATANESITAAATPNSTCLQSQDPEAAKDITAERTDAASIDDVTEFAPPDTKYAWLIVAAAFCNLTTTMGTLNSFGVYQEYYLNDLYKNDSAVVIAWVSTLISFCMFFGSVVTGKLTDEFGFRITCLAGAIICGVALILASFTHTVWQLMLTQGIMLGLGASFIFSPSMSIVAQWHVKHRILATGIAVSGGGVGGMVFSEAAHQMMNSIGYRWSLRVLGLVIAAISGSVSLVYKPRVSAPKSGNAKLLYMLCKDPRFLCIGGAVTLINMGYFEPPLYVPTAAVKETGMRSTASNIVLVFNAGTTVGRILSGPISAVLGPLNANLASNVLSFILIFVLLQGVKTIAAYYTFSAIFGAISTLYLAINAHIMANEFGTHAIASSVGLSMACCGIGVLIGNPVQGALYESYDRPHDKFTAVTVWAGACFALASVCYAILRILAVRKRRCSYFSKM